MKNGTNRFIPVCFGSIFGLSYVLNAAIMGQLVPLQITYVFIICIATLAIFQEEKMRFEKDPERKFLSWEVALISLYPFVALDLRWV